MAKKLESSPMMAATQPKDSMNFMSYMDQQSEGLEFANYLDGQPESFASKKTDEFYDRNSSVRGSAEGVIPIPIHSPMEDDETTKLQHDDQELEDLKQKLAAIGLDTETL